MNIVGTLKGNKYRDFIEDIIAVCKKHKLSISHEDVGGAFVIHKFNDYDVEWLKQYIVRTQE